MVVKCKIIGGNARESAYTECKLFCLLQQRVVCHTFVCGGVITNGFSGNIKENFLWHSTREASRKARE